MITQSRKAILRTHCTLLAIGIAFGCGQGDPPATAPPEIDVVEVIQRDQSIYVELVGETRGTYDIPIRARVEGVVTGMHFVEGRTVNEGELLYSIDPSPYETKVVEAEGQLAEALTRLAKNHADLERIRPLAEIGAASQIELDAAVAQYEAALGAKKAAQARRDRARIELGYTRLSAPITGRIGITAAKVGEFVGRAPNPVVLNTISVIDPIRVRFALDEKNYLRLARRRITDQEQGNIDDRAVYRYEMILADGSLYPHRGRLVGTDAEIDPDTGTFTLEAEFPNPDRLVLSGQFARVRLQVDVVQGAILVPQRAIRDIQGKSQVFVIDAAGVTRKRDVLLGSKIGRLQIIEEGLGAGERIALQIARLEEGMKITPKPLKLDANGNAS